VECSCGRRHWGRYGAAGLLLGWGTDGARQVLLQHRALWSDQGGTWGVPGGALHAGEDPVAGALREATEEANVDPAGVNVVATHVLDHGPWRYTTVVGVVSGPQDPRPTDAESLEIAWVDADRVSELPLLVAFGDAWPMLRDLLPDPGR
jgi:8-oxo-dGTP pyrophosphatase MutT (NUDIX family)